MATPDRRTWNGEARARNRRGGKGQDAKHAPAREHGDGAREREAATHPGVDHDLPGNGLNEPEWGHAGGDEKEAGESSFHGHS